MIRDDENDQLSALARANRLHTKISEDATKIIPGKLGHIFKHDEGVLGVLVMPEPPRRQYWGCTRTALLKAGLSITQDGDQEGAATFDPDNPEQVKLAIRAAGIRRKRAVSPERKQQLIHLLQTRRGRAPSGAGSEPMTQDDTRGPVANLAAFRDGQHTPGSRRCKADGRRCLSTHKEGVSRDDLWG